jgi:hypothetical protein
MGYSRPNHERVSDERDVRAPGSSASIECFACSYRRLHLHGESCLRSFPSASIARWLACAEASGSPPKTWTSSSLLTCKASRGVLPAINSVKADPHATAGTHPWTRNLTSESRPSVSLAVNLRISPHTGFSTCAEASGDLTRPAWRGCSKWSRTCGEYTRLF